MNRVKVFKKYEKLRNVKSDFILPVRKGKRPAMLWFFFYQNHFTGFFFGKFFMDRVIINSIPCIWQRRIYFDDKRTATLRLTKDFVRLLFK